MRGAVTVEQGTVAYRETGPADGPTVVFVHGAFVDGTLWRKVTPRLDDRCAASSPTCRWARTATPMSPAPTSPLPGSRS